MDPPLRMVGNVDMKPSTFIGVSTRKAISPEDMVTLSLLLIEVVRRNPEGFDDSFHGVPFITGGGFRPD